MNAHRPLTISDQLFKFDKKNILGPASQFALSVTQDIRHRSRIEATKKYALDASSSIAEAIFMIAIDYIGTGVPFTGTRITVNRMPPFDDLGSGRWTAKDREAYRRASENAIYELVKEITGEPSPIKLSPRGGCFIDILPTDETIFIPDIIAQNSYSESWIESLIKHGLVISARKLFIDKSNADFKAVELDDNNPGGWAGMYNRWVGIDPLNPIVFDNQITISSYGLSDPYGREIPVWGKLRYFPYLEDDTAFQEFDQFLIDNGLEIISECDYDSSNDDGFNCDGDCRIECKYFKNWKLVPTWHIAFK